MGNVVEGFTRIKTLNRIQDAISKQWRRKLIELFNKKSPTETVDLDSSNLL